MKVAPGPYAIGSKHWPGLGKLIEEAGEVQQVCGKLLGNDGASEHWDGTDLHARLESELADLQAAIEFVIEANGLNKQRIGVKRAKKLRTFRGWHACPTAPS